MVNFNVLLFNGFETLDAFGPAEVIGRLPDKYSLKYCSLLGGMVESSQGVQVNTLPFAEIEPDGVLLIPGGMGTRALVSDEHFICQLKILSQQAQYVLSVCTGSALLAKTDLLSGKGATSNKRAFKWVSSINTQVNWVKKARWVVDGKYYTSSGVSAGMDMALGFISDRFGVETANNIACDIEYRWNSDKDKDPFAVL